MAWFKKKPDPLSNRARALSQEIAQLEARIRELDTQVQRDDGQPRLRSTALPHGAVPSAASTPGPSPDPIFEKITHDRLDSGAETPSTRDHYNELGVRKYDLPALFRRLRNHFRGPAATNPKLVSYLAAGGIQGLRPLRYEKRVARNRFIALVAFLFLMLLGLLAAFYRR